jgi:hypothetical protein
MTEQRESIRIGASPARAVRPRRRLRWAIGGGAVVLAGLGMAAVGVTRSDAPAPAARMDIRGSITVPWSGSLLSATGSDCAGSGGYSDLAPGGQVTVTDETGKVVGVGRITVGQGSPYQPCVLLFEVAGVPSGARYYGVEVTHRGKIQKTEADLRSATLNLEIG